MQAGYFERWAFPALSMNALCKVAVVLAVISIPCIAESAEVDRAAGRIWGFFQAVKVLNAECNNANVANWNELAAHVEQWLERNAPVVEVAKKASLESLRNGVPDEAQYVVAAENWRSTISFLERRVRSDVLHEIERDPQHFCELRANILGSRRSELADLFPGELKSIGASVP